MTYNLPTYTITPSAGTGGTITPSDPVVVDEGDDQTFTIVPSAGYIVSDVLADSVSLEVIFLIRLIMSPLTIQFLPVLKRDGKPLAFRE